MPTAAFTTLFRERGQVRPDMETFNEVSYWSDAQLEDIVDNNKQPLTVRIDLVNDERNYWQIRIPKHYWLDLDTVVVTDNENNVLSKDLSTFGTFNEKAKTLVTTNEKCWQVFGLWVDLYEVLSELWDARAAQRYDYVQLKAGANTIRMQNEYEHCIKMRDYYRSKKIRSAKW